MNKIPLPKSEKELLYRCKELLAKREEFIIPPECGKGTGAPGHLLELLLGSNGSNKSIADSVGVEVKFHSSSSLLTLFHKEISGGNSSILPLVRKYGFPDKKGRLSFRHTIRQSDKFRVVQANGKIFVRSRDEACEVFWDANELLVPATDKLRKLLLIEGSVRQCDGVKYVKYISGKYLTSFKATDFLNAICGEYVLVDFDAREKSPGSSVLRNHGTKFRISVDDVSHVWGNIQTLV
jgi:hypothetical protein